LCLLNLRIKKGKNKLAQKLTYPLVRSQTKCDDLGSAWGMIGEVQRLGHPRKERLEERKDWREKKRLARTYKVWVES